jgi:hypothetical protein
MGKRLERLLNNFTKVNASIGKGKKGKGWETIFTFPEYSLGELDQCKTRH